MGWYELCKFLHVAASIIWLGAGFGLVILGMRAERQKDNAEYGRIIESVVYLAPRVFVLASLAVLVLGIIMTLMVWGFAQLWIVIGLIGFAATFITGNFLLRPRAERIAALIAKEGYSDEVVRQGSDLLSISKFDYVMLFVVVADMVYRPTLADPVVLLVMAAALVAGGLYFLRPVLMPQRA
jgi:uncharacterized membrane protein